ncbi:MAG TPA: hypothetical protein VH062_35590 [Polyangiaceae bacterium]|jgi:hypothetical protein|nr:hypothetical protein [Polyangiaceae bacterium]
MDAKLLIDAIVRQTTVLIAQLSTSAGIRAPLAHVADQVFLDLASEIEAQGVARKVAADMFGLALRSYQKKVQRLTESATVRERTLWEAVLGHLSEQGSVTREQLFTRFRHDPEQDVAAVLVDLINQGLVYSTGKGKNAVYGASSEVDRGRIAEQARTETVTSMVWLALYKKPSTRAELGATLPFSAALVDHAVEGLIAEGRVRREGGTLSAESFVVPVGSEQGWEAAVFDHFSAVASAIAAKVRRGARSDAGDVVGGATLTFEVAPDHPNLEEVYGLLARIRRDVNDVWARVMQHNERHALDEARKIKVTVYFGQNVDDSDEDVQEEAS